VRAPCQLWLLQDVLSCAFQHLLPSFSLHPIRPLSNTHVKSVTLVSTLLATSLPSPAPATGPAFVSKGFRSASLRIFAHWSLWAIPTVSIRTCDLGSPSHNYRHENSRSLYACLFVLDRVSLSRTLRSASGISEYNESMICVPDRHIFACGLERNQHLLARYNEIFEQPMSLT
jgi:hypothetical protein